MRAGEPVYASPTGTGAGTQADPTSLSIALASGGNIYLMDGVYQKDDVVILQNVTMQAVDGARPVITGTDGYPPAVYRGSGSTVTGVWFGGLRPASNTGSKTITNGVGGGFTDCTFFNYINGVQVGSDAHRGIYRRNRFVRCGYQDHLHPIYVANHPPTDQDGVLTEECVFVGCEGYSVHYYHEPAYGVAQYNFIGDARNGMALQGDNTGPVSGNYNVIWSVSQYPLYNSTTLGTCNGNVWQGCSKPGTPDDGNYFVDPVPTAGTNPHVWQEADVVTNLGKSSAQINAAISALETAFAASVATIQADATIETHFATLKAVIDAWKLVQ